MHIELQKLYFAKIMNSIPYAGVQHCALEGSVVLHVSHWSDPHPRDGLIGGRANGFLLK